MWSDFWNWLKSKMTGTQTVTVTQDEISTFLDNSSYTELVIEMFAIQASANLIANVISKCELQTYINKNVDKKAEWYLWNIEPNLNQNSNQFWNELVMKLLLENEVLVVDVGGQLLIAESFSKTE